MNTIGKNISSASGTSEIKSVRGASTGAVSQGTGKTAASVNVSAVKQTAQITGNMLLAQMKPGTTFSGDIIDVRGSAIKILLGNDKTLDASSTDSKNLNIGDHITFNVSSNNGKTVVIKPLKINSFNTNVLLKALEASDAPANEKNINIVKAMMRNEMSIDKNSLSDMIKKVEAFKTDNPENIVAMERHGIPLTQENVDQFSAYKNFEHRIMAQAESLAEDVPEMLKDILATENGSQKAAQIAKDIADILMQNLPNEPEESIQEQIAGKTPGETATLTTEITEGEVSAEDEVFLQKMGLSQDEGAVFVQETGKSGSLEADVSVRDMPYSEVMSKLNTLSGEELKEFLSSPEFKHFVKDKVEKNFELNVNKLGQDDEEVKKNVKKLYENLDKKTEALLNALENAGVKENRVGNTVNNIRNNMQFMQDLNQMAAYVQLPVKFSENKAHGDLYVFNRKKGMPVNKDVVTAFLHLDMESLGATDVHVSLEKKALKTDFVLSDGESAKIVEQHLFELKERLEKKGFTTTINVEIEPDDAKFNPFDKVLETDKPQISIKRYSFDVRA